jgi:hypothetical protein
MSLLFLAGSLLVSAAAWVYFDTALFFLFVPFLPYLWHRGSSQGDEPSVRECPQCGFRTRDEEYEYCPRDGRRLQREGDGGKDEVEGRNDW